MQYQFRRYWQTMGSEETGSEAQERGSGGAAIHSAIAAAPALISGFAWRMAAIEPA
jgi:hypothetical protein